MTVDAFLKRVEASYTVSAVEAGLLDKIKGAAKKASLVFLGLGLFSSSAAAFTGTGLKTYAKDTTKIFQDAGIDCKVDAKVDVQGKKQTATLTYKCSDGSSSSIKILKLGDKYTVLDMKTLKNAEGQVNPEIKAVALSVAKHLQEDLGKAHLDK